MAFNTVTLSPIPGYPADDLIQTASLNFTGLGTVVPGITGKRIFVHGYAVAAAVLGGTITYAWQDMTPAGGTVNAPMGTLGAGFGELHCWPFTQYPLFTIAPGDALAINPSGAIGGRVMYVQA